MKKIILASTLLVSMISLTSFALYGPNSVSASGDGSGTAYKVEVANNETVKEAMEVLSEQKAEMSVELQQELNKELLKIYIERNSTK